MWDTLQECNRFTLVVRQCFVCVEHKGQIQHRYPRAIRIPAEDTGSVINNAFYSVPHLRHVVVDAGIHTIGASAWQSCQQLQIVKLPASVACLKDGVFQGRYALMHVLAAGCIQFGRRTFAECCSLCRILANAKATNELSQGAQVSPYAFESCLALSNVSFEQIGAFASKFTRYMPEGCFCIEPLKLPPDFNFIGPIARENCKRLAFVDLSSTEIIAIWGSTFSHCVNLAHIWSPAKLRPRRIGKEAFMSCASLQEVYTPPALQYIAHRAFCDCEQLTQLIKMDGKTTWRGPYAESNTFALCAKFRRPEWLNMLPPNRDDSDALKCF